MAVEDVKMGSLSKEQPLDDLGNHIYLEKQDKLRDLWSSKTSRWGLSAKSSRSAIWEITSTSRSRINCVTYGHRTRQDGVSQQRAAARRSGKSHLFREAGRELLDDLGNHIYLKKQDKMCDIGVDIHTSQMKSANCTQSISV